MLDKAQTIQASLLRARGGISRVEAGGHVSQDSSPRTRRYFLGAPRLRGY